MTELKLFVDPVDVEFPGPVHELLKQATREHPVRATLTPENYCIVLCNNVMYTFKNEKADFIRTVKLNLPNGVGLQYTTNTVCLFQNNNSTHKDHPSALVVSPAGVLRYWFDVSKPHFDVTLQMNDQLTSTLLLTKSSEYAHYFLLSTTSPSLFHVINIYHNREERSDNVTHYSLEIATSSIARRMSSYLFGSFTGSQDTTVTKVLYVAGKVRSAEVEAITISSQVVRFISIESQQLLHEKNVAEGLVSYARQKFSHLKLKASRICIVDAEICCRGLLMFIAAIHENPADVRFISVNLFLGFLKEKRDNTGEYNSAYVPIQIPDSMACMERSKLQQCKLIVPNDDECVLVLHRSVIIVNHPTTELVNADFLTDLEDYTLGAAAVDQKSHVILSQSGICAIRRLPADFDVKFWLKYQRRLNIALHDKTFSDELFKKAFIAFASKNLNNAEKMVEKMKKKSTANIMDLALKFIARFLDCEPEDARWESNKLFDDKENSFIRNTQDLNNLHVILEGVKDKLSLYNMVVLFLRYYRLLDANSSISSEGGQSAAVLLAEMGEKLVVSSVYLTYMIDEVDQQATEKKYNLSLIFHSAIILGPEFARRFNHIDNNYLTACDHVFRSVSHIDEFISTILVEGERSLRGLGSVQESLRILQDVGNALCVLADGITIAKENTNIGGVKADSVMAAGNGKASRQHANGSVVCKADCSLWLQSLLARTTRHFEAAIKLLISLEERIPEFNSAVVVLSNCKKIADFILNQQAESYHSGSKIISSFISMGEVDTGLALAETYHDYTTIIEYCRENLDETAFKARLNHYKILFANADFDMFLLDYYRRNDMVQHIISDESKHLNEFLEDHKSIKWIRNIANGEYTRAYQILKEMVTEAQNADDQLIKLALCKLCLLCEDEARCDVGEIAEVSNVIRNSMNRIKANPDDMSVDQSCDSIEL